MENINLIDSFAEFKELKNIDRATMMSVIEDVFRSVMIRQFGTDENFDVIINIDIINIVFFTKSLVNHSKVFLYVFK